MEAIKGISWFIGLMFSIAAIYEFVGIHMMVNYFPEVKRWWQIPMQLASLCLFAAVIYINPF